MLWQKLELVQYIVAQGLSSGFIDGLPLTDKFLQVHPVLSSLVLDLAFLQLVKIVGLLDLLHGDALRL